MVQKLEQKELQVIFETSKRLQSIQTPDVLSQDIIKIMEDILNYDFGAVLLINEETQELVPFALSDQGKGPDFIEEDKKYIASKGVFVGKGITGTVAQTGKSILIDDVRKDPRYFSMRDYIRSELCVPIIIDEKIIGVVNTETSKINAYSETDQIVLEIVASQIGTAIVNARLYEATLNEIQKRTLHQSRLEALHRYNPVIFNTESIQELAKTTIEMINEILGFDRIAFLVLEDNHLDQIDGIPKSTFKVPLDGKGITVRTCREGKTQLVNNVSEDPDYLKLLLDDELPSTLSELCTPLLIEGQVVGVINVESEKIDFFTLADKTILEIISNTVAVAMKQINASNDLIESENRYRSLFSDSLEGIVIRDRYGIITAINQAGVEILGYDSQDELIGKPIARTWAEPSDHLIASQEIIDQGFKKNREIRIKRKNGSIGFISANAHVRSDSIGEVVAVETYFRDISEIKLIESEREKRRKLEIELAEEQLNVESANKLNNLKNKFMSTATHELRTPITSIQGYLEILLDLDENDLSDKAREMAEIVMRNAFRLSKLTDDLLDMQRLESGRLSINRDFFNLSKLVTDISLEIKSSLDSKNQKIKLNLDHVPDILGDSLRISQVLINVIGNASKFSPEGSLIEVGVHITKDYLTVSVRDEGVGLQPEDMEKLFIPFSVIEHDMKVSSTGLGLSISKGIVDLHGGDIWADSTGKNMGSTFFVKLPINN